MYTINTLEDLISLPAMTSAGKDLAVDRSRDLSTSVKTSRGTSDYGVQMHTCTAYEQSQLCHSIAVVKIVNTEPVVLPRTQRTCISLALIRLRTDLCRI